MWSSLGSHEHQAYIDTQRRILSAMLSTLGFVELSGSIIADNEPLMVDVASHEAHAERLLVKWRGEAPQVDPSTSGVSKSDANQRAEQSRIQNHGLSSMPRAVVPNDADAAIIADASQAQYDKALPSQPAHDVLRNGDLPG